MKRVLLTLSIVALFIIFSGCPGPGGGGNGIQTQTLSLDNPEITYRVSYKTDTTVTITLEWTPAKLNDAFSDTFNYIVVSSEYNKLDFFGDYISILTDVQSTGDCYSFGGVNQSFDNKLKTTFTYDINKDIAIGIKAEISDYKYELYTPIELNTLTGISPIAGKTVDTDEVGFVHMSNYDYYYHAKPMQAPEKYKLQLDVINQPKTIYSILFNDIGINQNPSTITETLSNTLGTKPMTYSLESIQLQQDIRNDSIECLLSIHSSPTTNSRSARAITSNPFNTGVGTDTEEFYDLQGGRRPATLRKIANDGTWTLQIWVEDEAWHEAGTHSYTVTDEMLTYISDSFLKNGANNDIFDWVTNIYGAPWGSVNKAGLISENKVINILLLDILKDKSTDGGALGAFHPRDNILYDSYRVKTTNERLMFYIDSTLLAVTNDSWDTNEYWAQQILLTLAHEFQHMINFYQGGMLKNIVQETFMNETLSLITEELISEKLGIAGPAGFYSPDGSFPDTIVQDGRIPYFNVYPSTPLFEWFQADALDGNGIPYVLRSYSAAYVYGAYLLRNAGGVNILPHIQQEVESKYNWYKFIDSGAIDEATDQVMKMYAALLVSDKINPGEFITFNNGGWFISSINGVEYKAPSLNFHKVSAPSFSLTGPYIFTIDDMNMLTELPPHTAFMYKSQDNFLGTYTQEIDFTSEWLCHGILAK